MSQIKIVTYFIVFLVAIYACEQQEEVINFDDIVKSSQKYIEDTEKKKISQDSLSYLTYPNHIDKLFQVLEVDTTEVEEVEKIDFLDRFENIDNQKFSFNYLNSKKTVKNWIFKDSLVSKMVFYNWIDHNQLDLYAVKRLKEESFCLIVLGNEIFMLNFSFHPALKSWIESLKAKKNQVLYVLTQGEIGNCIWLDNNLKEKNGKSSK